MILNRIIKFIILVVAININCINAHLLEGLYCGTTNCYDVLNVTRESTR